jgi:hypothetical protein
MSWRTCIVVTLLILTSGVATAADDVKIVVGPNYLVSRDGDVPHCEMMIAANPLDSKNLVASSITATRPDGGWSVRTYASRDGGATWRYSDFPAQVEFGGGDPQVVFTPDGTAITVNLTFGSVKDETGRPRGGMGVYRSEDGGFTWKLVRDICCSNDHPQMIVDDTTGRFAGRVYIGTLWDYPVYRIGIYRSDDDGRTWTGPVEAVNGGGILGVNVVSTAVMSDGTLVVPYVDFEYLPEKRKEHGKIDTGSWLVTSSDGGVTFSKPVRVQTLVWDLDQREALGTPFTAVDAKNPKYRDNIYMIWTDSRLGNPRVLFSRSTNRGQTWSKPSPIAGDVPEAAWQYQPTLAVNKSGVVGVTWYDTRDTADHSQFHMYFAASTDGGQTFMKPVRVTSEPSKPHGRGNIRPMPAVFEIGDTGHLSLLSAANRWASGGDYLGLTTTTVGTFFPLWADARSGTFQVYTAPIRVELPPTEEEKKKAAAIAPYIAAPKKEDPSKRKETSMVGKVEIVFDPATVEGNVVELALRLKNKSETNIYAPLRLEILDFGFPEEKRDRQYDPEVLNATNGKKAGGAQFAFDGALGDDGVLKPGMLSGPIAVRFKVVDPQRTPSIQFKIYGQTEPE